MAVSTKDRLQAELGVQASDLGLEEQAFSDRVKTWGRLAEETQPDGTRRYAMVKVYLLRTWITVLSRKVEKFRAEGEITVEQDVVKRIEVLEADLLLAQSAAAIEVPGLASFGPVVGGWGVDC